VIDKTHFGYQQVDEGEKARRVGDVFSSVAPSYDLMNDLMSLGLHRLWKRFAIDMSGVRAGSKVLDVASGSGDLAVAFQKRVGPGHFPPVALCDAEKLPFPSESFDCVSVAFGLRNMTHKDRALAEMARVTRAGGRVIVLEFSKPWKPLRGAYDAYSFGVLPRIGKYVARDEAAYRYLAESIRMHPDQEELKAMMETAGLAKVDYFNLAAGVVALHRGFRT
jgi:demethylmenaquinone methyltransferase/2-methoxy-6-polyprenyl-1,4-benzoquinol methylase